MDVNAAASIHEDFHHPHDIDHRGDYQRESTDFDDVIGVVTFVEGDRPF